MIVRCKWRKSAYTIGSLHVQFEFPGIATFSLLEQRAHIHLLLWHTWGNQMARNEERRVQVHRQMPASPGIIVTPGEDRSSHNRHLKILKWECRSVRPNKQVHYMPHLSFIYQFNLHPSTFFSGNKRFDDEDVLVQAAGHSWRYHYYGRFVFHYSPLKDLNRNNCEWHPKYVHVLSRCIMPSLS